MVDSNTYGKPIVTANNSNMREIGSSPPTGFQLSGARIGSTNNASKATTMCSTGCRRVPSARGVTSEYAYPSNSAP